MDVGRVNAGFGEKRRRPGGLGALLWRLSLSLPTSTPSTYMIIPHGIVPIASHLHHPRHPTHSPPTLYPHTILPTPSPTLHHHHTSAPTPSDPSKDLGKLSPVGHAQPPRGSLESRLPSESLVSHRVQRLQGGGNAGSPRLGGCRWVEHGMHCALPPPTAPPGGRHALHRTPASNPEGPGLAWPRALWGLG